MYFRMVVNQFFRNFSKKPKAQGWYGDVGKVSEIDTFLFLRILNPML